MIGRRSMISSLALTLVGLRALFAAQPQDNPYPAHNPRIPGHGMPNGADEEPMPRPDPKAILKENQKNLRHDVDQLLQLAQDLKTEADKIDQAEVLSLTFIHKAEEIEKLARQIKTLARAA